jgi:hypothetical protein
MQPDKPFQLLRDFCRRGERANPILGENPILG